MLRLENVGFEEAGLDFDRSGIRTDEQQRTNLPNVYAIGDVTGKSQLDQVVGPNTDRGVVGRSAGPVSG